MYTYSLIQLKYDIYVSSKISASWTQIKTGDMQQRERDSERVLEYKLQCLGMIQIWIVSYGLNQTQVIIDRG